MGITRRRDQILSSKRPSRPRKWSKLSTPRWAPAHDPRALHTPSQMRLKKNSDRGTRARFPKREISCQGRPMKAHAHPCLKPLMICTLPRSPYARQHDAMRCCCHAHGPRYCCRCCHTTAATLPLPHYFAKPLRAACTLMTPHCCCLAAATLLSSPPTLQSTETRLEYNQARNLQLSVTATTAPVASITTPVDLAANAIASTAFTSPTSIPPTRPHAISYILIYATTLLIPHVFPVSRLYLGEYLA